MNTVKSFWLGWGSLCVAGAGAYYFAKREINADRQAKLEAARKSKLAQRSFEYSEPDSSSRADGDGNHTRTDPSEAGSSRTKDKGKYESAAPYKSPKGDRFS